MAYATRSFRCRAVSRQLGTMGTYRKVYDTERPPLYVAYARARDLLVTSVAPASEFLDDLAG